VAVNPVGLLQDDASGAVRASCRGSTRTRRPAAGSDRVQRQHSTQRTSERETSGANHLFPQLRDASSDDTRSIAHSRSGKHPVWSGNSLIHSYDISGHSRAPQVTRGRAPISSSSTLDLHISWLRIVSTETRSAKRREIGIDARKSTRVGTTTARKIKSVKRGEKRSLFLSYLPLHRGQGSSSRLDPHSTFTHPCLAICSSSGGTVHPCVAAARLNPWIASSICRVEVDSG
jgi:hypothetical protein